LIFVDDKIFVRRQMEVFLCVDGCVKRERELTDVKRAMLVSLGAGHAHQI